MSAQVGQSRWHGLLVNAALLAMALVSIAPPAMPCRNRPAISTGALCASPQISEVRPKAAVVAMKTRLRPKRSASVPVAINTAVQAMV